MAEAAKAPIYLDYNAAAPLRQEAWTAMGEVSGFAWANPSSIHQRGRAARARLERAREQIAQAIGAHAADVVFTSGGTESCNVALFGLIDCSQPAHVVTTGIEHPAVRETVAHLREKGVRVTVLQTPGGQAPSANEVDALLGHAGDEQTVLALQWVNHETGVVFPIEAYAERCQARGVRLFVDATQALGKLPIDVTRLGAACLAFAAHKVGGPTGVGALWVARAVELGRFACGGSQERGRRPGTPSAMLCVGFGEAAACAVRELSAYQDTVERQRWFEGELVKRGAVINGIEAERVPSVVNASFQFKHLRGTDVVAAFDLEGVCVSSGAACSSGLSQPSKVIMAMYPDQLWRAESALRFSFGLSTTRAELEFALAAFDRILSRA